MVRSVKSLLSLLLIFALGIAVGYGIFFKSSTGLKPSKNQYVAFLSEIYDKTKDNYWESISDEQLINLYKAGVDKFSGVPSTEKPKTKTQLESLLTDTINGLNDAKKKEFSVNLASAVLSSLQPNGRSGLFNQKQEEDLKNTVQNVNPGKDLYQDLGIAKGASKEQIKSVYQAQKAELEPLQESSPAAKQKLDTINYAFGVLSKEDTKERYDVAKIEPTFTSRLITPTIYYLKLDKFSPTSFDEFQKNAQSVDNPSGPIYLILDLRGNIGGAIDITPYFIGVFIGKNQYAFDFFHKGEYQPARTMIDKLPAFARYKQMVVLIDSATQSSAEILASALKRYKIGTVVGINSKGWGTVEKVFALDSQIDEREKYSMFLVHSLTIRDDGQPIEGRGVEPDVNTKDNAWQAKLAEILKNPELVIATVNLLK